MQESVSDVLAAFVKYIYEDFGLIRIFAFVVLFALVYSFGLGWGWATVAASAFGFVSLACSLVAQRIRSHRAVLSIVSGEIRPLRDTIRYIAVPAFPKLKWPICAKITFNEEVFSKALPWFINSFEYADPVCAKCEYTLHRKVRLVRLHLVCPNCRAVTKVWSMKSLNGPAWEMFRFELEKWWREKRPKA